jgi:uncharacterized membrane protein (DUF4010 family)
MEWNDTIKGLITAVGIGLMIGVIRERKNTPEVSIAGIRTHALIAVLGSLAWYLGMIPFIATLFIVGAFAVASYRRTADKDPGLTGEVTMILTYILSATAHRDVMLAAGLGVLCAILLKSKSSIHRMSRELISEQEVGDALLILASALIVLPLLPSKAIDPWGVIELNTIWRIVVLIMALGMFGHIAKRALGDKFGLPVAGFFSGFASSTAAIASLGHRAAGDSSLLYRASCAALLANLSSLILFCSVIGAASPTFLNSLFIPFAFSIFALILVAGFYFKTAQTKNEVINQTSGQTFKLSHALIIALAISFVSLLSVWMNDLMGDKGVLMALSLVSLVEIHAAGASLGQVVSSNGISVESAQWGVILMMGMSSLAKIVLSFVSGGRKFGTYVSIGLVTMMLGLLIGKLVN